MANTVNVNFKMDADVKKRMERACSEMGLSMSAAFTIFAKKVGREYRPSTLKAIFAIWRVSCRTSKTEKLTLPSMT